MADLKIPKLNMNSDKYIFKKNLTLRRKSNKRLFIESVFMFILSLFLVYLNYLIPNKILLLQKVPTTLFKSFVLLIDLFSNLYEIFLVIFIFISSVITFILLIGSFYRIFRIINRKQRLKKIYK
ncbi:putative Nucleoside diphosphate kinase [Prochlorococcus marinus str. MIT 9107]|uniref:Putative Nucleoside diphosphate kinase n=1 Tax=Prochlorococcus marinus str. MIT 9116 TaxID=167544 RepID=A0A0A1ZLJ2_PROMR|nr:putative Nucleoside diphosphate kinase [Prochlorococcus marinus str. MIT 9107]KGF90472.1 putative Nucleoside diphosphate kinase [Prochlorococcus marinus str. MIT 9116]KGF92951.1 putative Nucleoside diphosphate kinase [Prochlorococcus marinus str. MIT 9123]